MRLATACRTCRRRRRKCRFTNGPNTSCDYCISKCLQCAGFQPVPLTDRELTIPDSASTNDVGQASLSTSATPKVVILPPPEVCSELLSLYFDHIHDQFHSLFHRPSLEDDLVHDKIPNVIMFAIVALTARFVVSFEICKVVNVEDLADISDSFSTHPFFDGITMRERSRMYTDESVQLLDLGNMSLSTIQACVLIGTIRNSESQPEAGSIYYAVAIRISSIIDLPGKIHSSWIEKEVNIRVWWTLYMTETWSSYGLRLPKQMSRIEGLHLPSNDVIFHSIQVAGNDTSPDAESGDSLLGQMVKLHLILIDVNSFNSHTVAGDLDEADTIRIVNSLSKSLDDWQTALPDHLLDTPENLERCAAQGLGRMFVALYLGYYNYGQLLFYQFLHSCPHSLSIQSHHFAEKCKAYATQLCEITYRSHETAGCEVYYMMAGHVLAIASTVQIYALVFAEMEEEIQAAKYRLERNFEILTKLKGYWPTLDISFERFQEFHRVCQVSVDESFRMDRWMLTFLLEFAKPIIKIA